MIETIEDSRTEFKVKLVDDLEESVIAFLNKDGGDIYIGIDDNGNVSLNNDYYFRVATLKGQNISARNMRLTHAVIDTWRLDKSADGCEVLKESELKKLIF